MRNLVPYHQFGPPEVAGKSKLRRVQAPPTTALLLLRRLLLLLKSEGEEEEADGGELGGLKVVRVVVGR